MKPSIDKARNREVFWDKSYSEAMGEPASIFDLVDEDAKKRAIAQARASVEAGRVVDHEIVAEWLEKLARGEKIPPPLI